MRMEKLTMASLASKLEALGGIGPDKAREWRIRCALGWHTKARTAVRHMLRGEQNFSVEEAKQIEAAFVKHCAEKVTENNDENKRLFEAMGQALAAMQATDPEFYAPHIEAVRNLLFPSGNVGGDQSREDMK